MLQDVHSMTGTCRCVVLQINTVGPLRVVKSVLPLLKRGHSKVAWSEHSVNAL
jgi:hypothetical protein